MKIFRTKFKIVKHNDKTYSLQLIRCFMGIPYSQKYISRNGTQYHYRWDDDSFYNMKSVMKAIKNYQKNKTESVLEILV